MPDDRKDEVILAIGGVLGYLVAFALMLIKPVAAVGAVMVGFRAYDRAYGAGPDGWPFLAVAGSVFCALVLLCRK